MILPIYLPARRFLSLN